MVRVQGCRIFKGFCEKSAAAMRSVVIFIGEPRRCKRSTLSVVVLIQFILAAACVGKAVRKKERVRVQEGW